MLGINLGFFILGVAVAGIGILGFVIFFSDRKSLTNRTFLIFSLITVAWSVANYLSSQEGLSPLIELWWLRLVIFLGVWHAFTFFQLFYVFPDSQTRFPRWYRYGFFPITAISSIINLTPLSFSTISQFSSAGEVSIVNKGPGMLLFILVVIFGIVGGLIFLIKKLRQSKDLEKRRLWFVFWGALLTIVLIFLFNFFLPAFFDWVAFIPFTGIFIFPFIALTSLAIIRYHFLNIKAISTEIVAFLLTVTTLFEIFGSANFLELFLRIIIFLLVLIFSVLLIQSVLKEVGQREELQRLDKELEVKNGQLEDLSRFKSQLLSLASHQIRSPLAAIKGFASLVTGGSYGVISDKAKEAVEKMGKSANELIGLINTLLDVRKVEEGKMEYQFARTDLNKIVGDVVSLLQPLAETKKLEFKFDSPGKEIPVNADAEKLKQVVQNLVDNSIKYTPAGFVHVALKEENGAAIVSVSDSGVGVPATLIPHLFEEFIRDDRVKKQILGTGLGLFIARKIAEAHGGTISAESEGEGKGSTFRMTMPEMK